MTDLLLIRMVHVLGGVASWYAGQDDHDGTHLFETLWSQNRANAMPVDKVRACVIYDFLFTTFKSQRWVMTFVRVGGSIDDVR